MLCVFYHNSCFFKFSHVKEGVLLTSQWSNLADTPQQETKVDLTAVGQTISRHNAQRKVQHEFCDIPAKNAKPESDQDVR